MSISKGGLHLDKCFYYTTKAGDTFDILALDAYNNSFKAPVLIQANPQYSNILVFEAGIQLKIPIIKADAAATLPPWKR